MAMSISLVMGGMMLAHQINIFITGFAAMQTPFLSVPGMGNR